jgi:hypothetical protein
MRMGFIPARHLGTKPLYQQHWVVVGVRAR